MGDGKGEGDGEGDGEGEGLGLGEAPGDGDPVGEALTETLGDDSGWGRLTGAGPLFKKMNAAGTIISPTSTVSTKVTAPHSRRMNWPQSTTGDSTD